ncbi:MAG: hypothetical protein ACE5IY_20215 [bacterium]
MLGQRLQTEVVELHQFFEGWFTGRLADTEENFSRLSSVMADDFELISPTGQRRKRAGLIVGLKQAHASRANSEPPYRIWIKNVHSRVVDDRLYVVTYEEWQMADGKTRGRQSTALLRDRPDTPNGVDWLHVHETWLQDGKEILNTDSTDKR